MNSDTIFKKAIVASAIVLGLVSCAHSGNRDRNRDGNPIGFDIVGKPSTKVPTLSGNGDCLSKMTCTTVEWHYLANPAPKCPSSVPSGAICSPGTIRALPSCPDGAECITFIGKPGSREIDIESQYDPPEYHGPERTGGMGMVIFR